MATDVKEKSENKIAKFFRELKAEAKRITWPSQKDFKKATLAVVVFCLIWIVVVFAMDYGWRAVFEKFVFKSS